MSKPPFDPSKPFEVAGEEKPAFDPTQPYEEVSNTGLSSLNAPATPNDPSSATPQSSFQGVDTSSGATAHANPLAVNPAGAGTVPPRPFSAFQDIPQLISKTVGPAADTAGLISGATIGAEIGTGIMPGIGTAVGAVIGGGIGYATTHSATNLLDRALDLKKPIKDLPEAIRETGSGLKQGIETSLMGENAGAMVSSALGGASKFLISGAKYNPEQVASIMEKAKTVGVNLTPAEITGSKNLSRIESVFDTLPWTSDLVEKFRVGQLKNLIQKRESMLINNGSVADLEQAGGKIQNMVNDYFRGQTNLSAENMQFAKDHLLEKLGSKENFDALGLSIQQARGNIVQVLHDASQVHYKNFSELAGDAAKVVPENTSQVASKLRDEIMATRPQLRDNKLLAIVNSYLPKADPDVEAYLNAIQGTNADDVAKLAQKLGKKLEPMSAQQIVGDRKAINDLIDQNTDYTVSDKGILNAKAFTYLGLKNALDKDMQALATSSGNQTLVDSLQLANKSWGKYQEFLNDPVVKKIAKDNPEAIVGTLFSPGNETVINKFKQQLGPEIFNRAKNKFIDSSLKLSDPETPLTGDHINKLLDGYGETINAILKPDEVENMRGIADMLNGEQSATRELIKNPLLQSIVRDGKAPNSVINTIVKPKDTGNANIVKQFLGNEAMQSVREGFLPQLLTTNQNGEFSPYKFSKAFNTYGRETLESWFPKKVVDSMENLAAVSARSGGAERMAGNPSGTSGHLITMGAGAAVITNPLKSVGILVGSRALAQLYLSDVGREMFTQGLLMSPLASARAELSGKLIGYLSSKVVQKFGSNDQ